MHATDQPSRTRSARGGPTAAIYETPSISLVLPAWNECHAIGRAIAEGEAALRGLTDDYEIIVVDDGSCDGTAELVCAAAAANPRIRLLRHPQNRGYGAALRSGFEAASKDLVVFTDADSQFDLTELDRFVLLSERYDVVCGYRIDRKDGALRCFYSAVYNLLVRVLLRTGVRDIDCALKMFRRDVVKKLEITSDGFLVNSELLTQARQRNCSIVEVGVSHRPRIAGSSTVSVTHIPRVFADLVRYWWNVRQFPASAAMQASDGEHAPAGGGLGWMRFLLLAVAAIFLLTNLGYPLIDRDETRYAEIPREMLVTGNWILPQLNFEPYYDKPPLLYWLCAASYKAFGVSEWSARLVPAGAAWALLCATMWFAGRVFDRRTSLISGVVLFLSVGFVFTSRYLLIDGLMSLLVALSLFTAYESVRAEKVRLAWWGLSSLFCGLGFLAKGPVSMVLLLPPIFAVTWLSSSLARPRWWHYAISAGIVAVVVSPWLIAVALADASFPCEFFLRHNFRRFAGEFHARPFWFFVPVLLVAGHPWSFLAIPLTRFMFSGEERLRARRPPVLGFLVLWSAWCFLFFSVSRCKLPTYILPAAPALAVIVAWFLNQVIDSHWEPRMFRFARLWSARTAAAASCLAGVGFIGYGLATGIATSTAVCMMALLWSGLLVGMWWFTRDARRAMSAWATSSAVAFVLAIMVMHWMVPAYSRSRSIFGPSSPLAEQLKIGRRTAIATVDHEFSEVPFYLDRSDIPNLRSPKPAQWSAFANRHHQALLIVDDRTSVEAIRRHLPAGRVLHLVAARGPARFIQMSTAPITQRLTASNRVEPATEGSGASHYNR